MLVRTYQRRSRSSLSESEEPLDFSLSQESPYLLLEEDLELPTSQSQVAVAFV